MASNIVAINSEQHANLKLVSPRDFDHIKDKNIVSLVVYEFTLCATECPIIFIKGQETGRFQAVALMGFKPGNNYFVSDNKWTGLFIPGIVATYPFRITPHPQSEDQLFLAADLNTTMLSEEEGEPLFDADKKETELFSKIKADVSQYYKQTQITDGFCQMLAEWDLLSARDLNVDLNGEKITIQSVYMIDDEKLNALSDDKILQLHKRGLMPAIYAHKNSLHQMRRLAEMSKPAEE